MLETEILPRPEHRLCINTIGSVVWINTIGSVVWINNNYTAAEDNSSVGLRSHLLLHCPSVSFPIPPLLPTVIRPFCLHGHCTDYRMISLSTVKLLGLVDLGQRG